MLNNVEKLASESLAWGMMPLQQWAEWSDNSRKSLELWVSKSLADQEHMIQLAQQVAKETQTAVQAQAKDVAEQAQAAVEEATQQSKAVLANAQQAVEEATQKAKQVVEEVTQQAKQAVDEATQPSPSLSAPSAPFVATPDAVQSEDDLTRISGVGPALAKKLAAAGFTTFGQIAELSDEQIADLEANVIRFSGRIQRDDWKGQAKDLLQGA